MSTALALLRTAWPWLLAAVLGALAAAGVQQLRLQGARAEGAAALSQANAEHDREREAAATAALANQQALADASLLLANRLQQIDTAAEAARRSYQHEIDTQRAAVERGAVRLRVAAQCPPAAGGGETGLVPGAASAGLGAGAAAELEAAARPAYFALASGIAEQRQQLLACQQTLAAIQRSACWAQAGEPIPTLLGNEPTQKE